MARKKPARAAAKKKSAPRVAVKKTVKKTAKMAVARGAKAVRRGAKAVKAAARKTRKPIRKAAHRAADLATSATKKARAFMKKAHSSAQNITASIAPSETAAATGRAAVKAVAGVKAAFAASKKPNLDRQRKSAADIHGIPSSLGMADLASAAHSGQEDLNQKLRRNKSASPVLTAGDVDADWGSAEAVGDEAPGGDNPTPDQDVVDEIGRALGVEYADDEELQGGAEIAERDAHRWELDPNSKDDFDDEA